MKLRFKKQEFQTESVKTDRHIYDYVFTEVKYDVVDSYSKLMELVK